MHKKQQHIIDVYGKPITTLDELAESCIAVNDKITPVVGFAWDIRYNPRVRCSHNAPIGQQTNQGNGFPGLTGRFWIRYADDAGDSFDWIRNMNHTLTWTGRIQILGGVADGPWQSISSASHRTRSKVEDSRGYRYEYPTPKCFGAYYKIFLSDWPDLEYDFIAAEAAHELEENKKEVWAKVSKTRRLRQKFIFRHKFTWEDPATKAADNKFLTEYFDSHKYITCD